MSRRTLEADCRRCAGLCCVALAFDRGEWFSFDKAANAACPQLLPTNQCAIHETLTQRGLPGCAHYDCYGAGQRVTQELFAGRSWRGERELGASMFEAFRVMAGVHELLLLLRQTERIQLSPARTERRDELLAELEPANGWTAEAVEAFDESACRAAVYAFLRTLRDSVGPGRRLPVLR